MSYVPEPLRKTIIERAQGYCEYCLVAQVVRIISFEIDHIIPEKHRGETVEENLCYACFDCNRHKGSDFASFDPESNQIALFYNPRRQRWIEHFNLDGALIQPLTPQGRVTVFILKLNDPERVREQEELLEAGIYPPAHILS